MTMIMRSIAVVMIVLVIVVMMRVRAMSVVMVVRAATVVVIVLAASMLRLLLLLRLLMMRGMLVVLLQQIEPVVVAVGCAHDGMNMELRGFRVGEEHAGVMVELDERHRALHPVVERAVLAESADPAEMRFGKMPLDLHNTCLARPVGQAG